MNDLSKLALKYGTDKYGSHYYTTHYYRNFQHLREQPIKLLEIGIGGYEDAKVGAESLKMWKEFFPNGQIYGLDIEDKRHFEEERIKIFHCSQTDTKSLDTINKEFGPFDIIIDDGSHVNEHIITTFEHMFPLLKEDGIYSVEDIQTAYWPPFGGNSHYFGVNGTCMSYFKQLMDKIHYEEILNPNYKPDYFALNVIGLQVYHNLAFIFKGKNAEGSNGVDKSDYSETKMRSRLKYYKAKFKSFVSH